MKTSYLKYFDKDGTVYDQTITIKNENFLKVVNDKVKLTLDTIAQKTVLSESELKLLMYLKPLNKGRNFTTHTLRDFIFNGILGEKVKNRNTIINIK